MVNNINLLVAVAVAGLLLYVLNNNVIENEGFVDEAPPVTKKDADVDMDKLLDSETEPAEKHVTFADEKKVEDVNMTGNDVNMDGNDVNMDGNDVNMDGNDVNMAGNDVNMAGNNVNMTGNNVNITGNDVNMDTSAAPAMSNDYSLGVTDEMKQVSNFLNKGNKTFNANDFLPQEVHEEWFDTDFASAQLKLNQTNLVNVDRYNTGVDTVGQSQRIASWDIRGNVPCPKFNVSVFNNSTVEPDYNLTGLVPAN